MFSAGGGHVAQVFTGLTRGWQAPAGTTITAMAVAEHLREITDPTDFATPLAAWQELEALSAILRTSTPV